MPSIINASLSSGLVTSADNSGVLELQSNGTTALTVTTGREVQVSTAGSASAPVISKSDDTNTGIFFPAADTIAFAEGGAEIARFDSAGNFGIGETSPAGSAGYTQLVVRGSSGAELSLKGGTTQYGYMYVDNGGFRIINPQSGAASGTLQFSTSNTERMRITSGGSVLINGTDTSYSPYIQATGNCDNFNLAVVKNTGTNYTTGTRLVTFVNSSNAIAGVISHSGVTSVTYGTSSDERLKENIVDAPNALDKVMDIKIRSYDWKEDSSHVEYGLVAQELHSVYGEPVGVGGEDITQNAWSIEYGRLTPILLKAIQELKAELDATKAEVALLKGTA